MNDLYSNLQKDILISDLIPKQYHQILKIELVVWRMIHENPTLYKEYYTNSLEHIRHSKWYSLWEKNRMYFNNPFIQKMVLMREIYLLGIQEGQRIAKLGKIEC